MGTINGVTSDNGWYTSKQVQEICGWRHRSEVYRWSDRRKVPVTYDGYGNTWYAENDVRTALDQGDLRATYRLRPGSRNSRIKAIVDERGAAEPGEVTRLLDQRHGDVVPRWEVRRWMVHGLVPHGHLSPEQVLSDYPKDRVERLVGQVPINAETVVELYEPRHSEELSSVRASKLLGELAREGRITRTETRGYYVQLDSTEGFEAGDAQPR